MKSERHSHSTVHHDVRVDNYLCTQYRGVARTSLSCRRDSVCVTGRTPNYIVSVQNCSPRLQHQLGRRCSILYTIDTPCSRGVRELLLLFTFAPTPVESFPFPSHSHSQSNTSFPFHVRCSPVIACCYAKQDFFYICAIPIPTTLFPFLFPLVPVQSTAWKRLVSGCVQWN